MVRRQRLDLELVARGLAASRQQAQQLIRAGRVRGPHGVLDKPGTDVMPGLPLEVKQPPRYVSRGGEKLAEALRAFPIRVADRVCIDGGISTGGFSDCLLQHGAALIYGIDVGYGQTAWRLRSDPRVVLRERTNLRHLTPEILYTPAEPRPDLAVADVSFISLGLILPALLGLLRSEGEVDLIVLVKPQFEVGRDRVGKGGVVREPAAHADAISAVISAANRLGLVATGLVASPITGPAGNHEYLLWLQRPDQDGRSGSAASGALDAGTHKTGPVETGWLTTCSAGEMGGSGCRLTPEQGVTPEQIEALVARTLTPRAWARSDGAAVAVTGADSDH